MRIDAAHLDEHLLLVGVEVGPITLRVVELRHVHESLDALLDLDEDAEVGPADHCSLDDLTKEVARLNREPWVIGKLLDAEAEALVVPVDVEDAGFDFVALVVHLARVLDSLTPREVRDVDKAVDSFLDSDEDTEVGDVPTAPLMMVPTGYFSSTTSQGLASSCRMPRLMRLFSTSTPSTFASTRLPISTSFDGCLTRLFQVISEMWTKPSMLSSELMKQP